jgi:hypothetical protein
MIDNDPETAELEFLAKAAPSKFKIMTITDKDTGLQIRVDQSMDSSFSDHSEKIKSMLEKMVPAYSFLSKKKYDGYIDGQTSIDINGLLVDFDGLSGEKAHNWLTRYLKVLLDLMQQQGIMKITRNDENGK